jgi:hypothetical protein
MNNFMSDRYQPFIESFRSLAILILTLYVMIGAMLVFTGRAEKPREMMWTALAVFIISSVVFSYDLYKEWLLDPIIALSFKLQSYFLTGNSVSSSELFDNIDDIFRTLFNKLYVIAERENWINGANLKIVCFLLAAIYGLLYLLYSILIISSIFAVYIFFVIGGIPLFLAVMPATRFVFWAWLRAVATYALIPVFASIVMAVLLSAIADIITVLKIDSDNVWNYNVGSAFFVGFLAIFFLFKCSEFAAALTGGQPSSIGGFVGSAISIGALATMPAARRLAPKIAGGLATRAKKKIAQDYSDFKEALKELRK